MTQKIVGWAYFMNEASQYSESFQEEMSKQLEQRFNQFLQIENVASDKGFMLFVGMTDLKIVYQDGYGFGIVEVISPNSFTNYLTFYWKTNDPNKLESAMTLTALDSTSIEFGWCADFNASVFLNYINTVKKLDSKKHNLAFEVEYDFQLFPDLSIEFEFTSKPDDIQLKKIQRIITASLPKAYVSEISQTDEKYLCIIDFQDQEYQEASEQLLDVVKNLNESDEKEITKLIRIK